jgi:hypothetical protein
MHSLQITLRLQFHPASWPTDHHDNQNSGASFIIGPAPAPCSIGILDSTVSNGTSARYFSSGIISPDNTYLYAGSSLNVLDFVEIMDETFTVMMNLNLSTCWAASGVAPSSLLGNYGIVFAGTAVNATLIDSDGVGRRDHLFIGSGDGHLYALNTAFCTGFSMTHCKGAYNPHLENFTLSSCC